MIKLTQQGIPKVNIRNIKQGIKAIHEDNLTSLESSYSLGAGGEGTVYSIPKTSIALKVLSNKKSPFLLKGKDIQIKILKNRPYYTLLQKFPKQVGLMIGTAEEALLLNKLEFGKLFGTGYIEEKYKISQQLFLKDRDLELQALTAYMFQVAQNKTSLFNSQIERQDSFPDNYGINTLRGLRDRNYKDCFKDANGSISQYWRNFGNMHEKSIQKFLTYFNELGLAYINELNEIATIKQSHFNDAVDIMHQLAQYNIETDHSHRNNLAYNTKYGFQFLDFQHHSVHPIKQLFEDSFNGFQQILLGYEPGIKESIGALISIDPNFYKQTQNHVDILVKKLTKAYNHILQKEYNPKIIYDYLCWIKK